MYTEILPWLNNYASGFSKLAILRKILLEERNTTLNTIRVKPREKRGA
jgi:hypothetical protein